MVYTLIFLFIKFAFFYIKVVFKLAMFVGAWWIFIFFALGDGIFYLTGKDTVKIFIEESEIVLYLVALLMAFTTSFNIYRMIRNPILAARNKRLERKLYYEQLREQLYEPAYVEEDEIDEIKDEDIAAMKAEIQANINLLNAIEKEKKERAKK